MRLWCVVLTAMMVAACEMPSQVSIRQQFELVADGAKQRVTGTHAYSILNDGKQCVGVYDGNTHVASACGTTVQVYPLAEGRAER